MRVFMPKTWLVIAVAAGVCLGLGYVFSLLWPAVFVGSALMLASIVHAQSAREVLQGSFVASFIGYGLAFSVFVFTTLPLDWLGITSPVLGFFTALFVCIIGAASLAASFSFSMGLVHFLSKNSVMRVYALFPFAWVLNEWLGPLLFSVVHAGPFSRIHTEFSVASFSYALAESPVLLQSAWLGGIFALAALIGIGGVGFHSAWGYVRNGWLWRGSAFVMVAGLFIIGGSFFHVSPHDNGKSLSIGLITMYEDPDIYIDAQKMQQRFLQLSDFFAASSAELIVFPEDSRFLEWVHNNNLMLPKRSDGSGFIIDSATVREGDGALRPRIETYDTARMASDYHYKSVLVPLGEYVPYLYQYMLIVLGQRDFFHHLATTRGFESSSKLASPIVISGTPVAVALCEESASPFLYRAQVRSGAQVLVNLSSHSWFHSSHLVHDATIRFAKVRAVESRRFFIRSADAAPSIIVDPQGVLVGESSWRGASLLERDVYLRDGTTPYVRYGVLPVMLVLMMYGVSIIFLSTRARFDRGKRGRMIP